MAIKTFTREQLDDLDLPYSCVEENYIESHRWCDVFEGIFKDDEDGKYYRVQFARGSTEMQEDTDIWQYYGKTIDAVEVELRAVTVNKWVAV